MYWVGIDWADAGHQICMLNSKEAPIYEGNINHSHSGFACLEKKFQELDMPNEKISIICETKHNLLIDFLNKRNYRVYVVNPKAIDRFRDTLRQSATKSDRFDAFCLAHFLKANAGRLAPLEAEDENVKRARALSRFRSRLVKNKVTIQNALIGQLKSYYPRSLELFGLDTAVFAAFLRAYPTPPALRQESEEGFQAFLKSAHYTYMRNAQKLGKIAVAEQIEADPILEEAASTFALMLLDQLELVSCQIKDIEAKMKHLISSYEPAKIISSIPGAGDVVSTGIVAGLGALGRFCSASAVQCIAGTAPVTRQSGNYKYVKMRKSCNKNLRDSIQHLAFASVKQCAWAEEFYQSQRQRGKRHHSALRALGNKWIRIIHAMLKENKPYDEGYHLLNQQRFQKV